LLTRREQCSTTQERRGRSDAPGQIVSLEQRQIIVAELHAPDLFYPTSTRAQGIDTRTGKQQIVLTQPLGTTAEDTQPTYLGCTH
jgi:hypothetical protein